MRISITSDANWETKTDRISRELTTTHEFFSGKSYGDGVGEVGMVLMCRDPTLNFRQRIIYRKRLKEFYIDIMLDYEYMIKASMIERMTYTALQIKTQMKVALDNKSIPNFDKEAFLRDLYCWLDGAVASYDGRSSDNWKY